jgi:N-acetylmuramate 1-kinase
VSEPINPLITAKIRAVFGADQTLTALVPLAGDASSRRYYRAILSGTGTPPSIIVMELPAGSSLPLSSEELAIFKEGPKELPFLNVHRFLSRTGVNVPQILGAWEKD